VRVAGLEGSVRRFSSLEPVYGVLD
jgi:hypothetical protein